MSKKKDYTIAKIDIERNFADEIYKKYRSERFGIGSCCKENFKPSINDKQLCDYQEKELKIWDKNEKVVTKYTVPEGGAQNDTNKPAWVEAACGMDLQDIEIYFYYDTTSLGLVEVQNAYYATTAWVEELENLQAKRSEGQWPCTNKPATISFYHTAVCGERWLDWGSSAITGQFNTSGTSGGIDTCCTVTPTCTAPDYGACQSSSYSDAVIPSNANQKFWQILKWAQDNGITFHNAGGAGHGTAIGGTYQLASPGTIGEPPAAANKNMLVVCFIDEATSGTNKQPYHDTGNVTTGQPMTWALASSGVGSAADGSDAVLTECWHADYAFFLGVRASWLAQTSGRSAAFFCYPSYPANLNNGHRPFALHALGAISSGDKPPAAATGSVTFTGNPTNGQTIIIRSADSTTITYTAGAATDITTNTFKSTGTVTEVATALKDCIEATDGHNGKIIVSQNAGVLNLTQSEATGFGNTTITETLSNATAVSFTGGTPDGTFTTGNAPWCAISNLSNIENGNPYFEQGVGALDQYGWGINPATEAFTAEGFKEDLNEFVDIKQCNDSECILFVVKDQDGKAVECYDIIWDGGKVGTTDEYGIFRLCVDNASIDTDHTLDLCYCVTTTGNCNSQKIAITVTDDCAPKCTEDPYQACEVPAEAGSSGNLIQGCTDINADNYNPQATSDDGSCIYCQSFTVTGVVTDATMTGASCDNDGAINISVTGGVGPYTYQWSGASTATSASLTGICGGTYTLTVTDSSTNPCIASATFYVDQPPNIVYGCMQDWSCNYASGATHDDGMCMPKGCMDPSATNYLQAFSDTTGLPVPNLVATHDCNCAPPATSVYMNAVGWNSCCTYCVDGCMDPNANNYNAAATCDDGSCTYNYDCVQVPSGTGVGFIDDSAGVISNPVTNIDETRTINCQSNMSTGFFGSPADLVDSWSQGNQGSTITTLINTLRFESTIIPSASYNCDLGPNNGAYSVVTDILLIYPNDYSGLIQGGTLITPQGFSPTPAKYYQNWQSVINDLNNAIAGGVVFNDNGVPATTFTGKTYSQIKTILTDSAITIPSTSNTMIMQFYELFGECKCDLTTAFECECQQKLDGTGQYADVTDCQQAINCCNDPETMYTCEPGTITNTCSDLTQGNTNIHSNYDSIADSFTDLYPNVDNPAAYWWDMAGNQGNCYNPGLNLTPTLITRIWLEHEGQGVLKEITPVSGWTWMDILGFVSGLSTTSVSGMVYTDIKQLINPNTNTPGHDFYGWEIGLDSSHCSCTQTGCQCVEDVNGTYASEADCLLTCCPGQSPTGGGCTDPVADNYDATATFDDGSCYYCNNLNVTMTVTTSDASSYGVSNAQIDVNPAGGSGSYTIEIANINGTVVNNGISSGGVYSTGPILAPGTYVITLSDSTYKKCEAIQSVVLNEPSNPDMWLLNYGTLTDSTDLGRFINTADSSLQAASTAFANDAALLDAFTAHSWQHHNLSTTQWGYVAGSTDTTKCYNAIWGGTKRIIQKIEFKVAGTTSIAFDSTYSDGWSGFIQDVANSAGFMNDTSIYTKNYSQFKTYVESIGGKTYTLVPTLIDGACSVSGASCTQDPSGTYTSQALCNTALPSGLTGTNFGCNQPTATLGYSSSAVYIDNDSCTYCSNFTATVGTVTAATGMKKDGSISGATGSYTGQQPLNTPDYVWEVLDQHGVVRSSSDEPLDLWPGVYNVMVWDIANPTPANTYCRKTITGVIVVGTGLAAACKLNNYPKVRWTVSGNYFESTRIGIDDNLGTYSGVGGTGNGVNVITPAGSTTGEFQVDLNPSFGPYNITIKDSGGTTIQTGTSVSILSSGMIAAGNYTVNATVNNGSHVWNGCTIEYTFKFV